MNFLIEVNNLKKQLESYVVFEHITCTFEQGKIYGIVGINGAGKSTFLKHLAGIYIPEEGNIIFDGQPIYEDARSKRKISFLPDIPCFLDNYSINKMIGFYQAYHGFDIEYFKELNQFFQLNLNKKVSTFSKGMKKQASLLLGLSLKADVIILDEIFDGLDPVMTAKIKRVFLDMLEKRNVTIIMSSHNLLGLDNICDTIYIMDQKRLLVHKDMADTVNYHKIQLYFQGEDMDTILSQIPIDIIERKRIGSVSNLVVRGVKEEIIEEINKFHPMIFDLLEFSYEERFVYEQMGGEIHE